MKTTLSYKICQPQGGTYWGSHERASTKFLSKNEAEILIEFSMIVHYVSKFEWDFIWIQFH